MAEHIPGPWNMRPARKSSNFGGFVAFVQKAPDTIAKVMGGPQDQAAVAEANARLIVAAPEYHAAAMALVEQHDGEASAANFRHCGCLHCNRFRPIIAKATGRS